MPDIEVYDDCYYEAMTLGIYNATIMENQRSILNYVNECICLESGDFDTLAIINESLVDTVKNILGRLWETVKKVYAKFKERVGELFTTDKDWLANNADVIKKNPFKKHIIAEWWNYSDEALNKIVVPQFKFDEFETATSGGNKYTEETFIKNHMDQKYNPDGKFKNDLDGLLDFALKGGEDPEEEVNMAGLDKDKIYNFVKNYQSTLNAIEKDNKTCGNNKLAIETEIEKFAKNVEANNANKNTEENNNEEENSGGAKEESKPAENKNDDKQAEVQQWIKDAQNQKWDYKQGKAVEKEIKPFDTSKLRHYDKDGNPVESSIYSRVYGRYITELKVRDDKGSTSNSGSAKGSTSGSVYNPTMKKEDKDKVIKDTGQKVDSMENQQANDISDGVKEFYKFCLDIISKKMNITVQRYKDYMQILRIHVRDYTGEEQGGGEGVGSGSGSSNTMPEEDQKALEELFKNGKAMVQDSEDKNKVHNWTMALERNSNETDYKKLTKKITKLGLKELAGNDTALGSLPVRDFFEQKISKETVAIASAKTGNQIAIVVKSGDATNAYLVDSEADITKIVTTIKKSGVNDQTNIISKMHLQASSKNNDNNNAAENKGNEENKPAENNNEGNK